jgi:hypothetical protein
MPGFSISLEAAGDSSAEDKGITPGRVIDPPCCPGYLLRCQGLTSFDFLLAINRFPRMIFNLGSSGDVPIETGYRAKDRTNGQMIPSAPLRESGRFALGQPS